MNSYAFELAHLLRELTEAILSREIRPRWEPSASEINPYGGSLIPLSAEDVSDSLHRRLRLAEDGGHIRVSLVQLDEVGNSYSISQWLDWEIGEDLVRDLWNKSRRMVAHSGRIAAFLARGVMLEE